MRKDTEFEDGLLHHSRRGPCGVGRRHQARLQAARSPLPSRHQPRRPHGRRAIPADCRGVRDAERSRSTAAVRHVRALGHVRGRGHVWLRGVRFLRDRQRRVRADLRRSLRGCAALARVAAREHARTRRRPASDHDHRLRGGDARRRAGRDRLTPGALPRLPRRGPARRKRQPLRPLPRLRGGPFRAGTHGVLAAVRLLRGVGAAAGRGLSNLRGGAGRDAQRGAHHQRAAGPARRRAHSSTRQGSRRAEGGENGDLYSLAVGPAASTVQAWGTTSISSCRLDPEEAALAQIDDAVAGREPGAPPRPAGTQSGSGSGSENAASRPLAAAGGAIWSSRCGSSCPGCSTNGRRSCCGVREDQ